MLLITCTYLALVRLFARSSPASFSTLHNTIYEGKGYLFKREGNKPSKSMMTVVILRGGTTYRDPKTSPAPGMFDCDMRSRAWSCVSDSGIRRFLGFQWNWPPLFSC
ncbi:hypothetical protein BDR03DRAFT_597216 [Suillus americanus]|nr:hypothetical protein BDR03DRAFT_597216 [Suillus americanus]